MGSSVSDDEIYAAGSKFDPPHGKEQKRKEARFHLSVALFHLREISPEAIPSAALGHHQDTLRHAEMLDIEVNRK